MVPLFQLFDFSYTDGLLFYDRSGALSRRLESLLPGLALKNASVDQRDFVVPARGIDLLFGIRFSRIQALGPSQSDFPAVAAGFLRALADTLDISRLREFHFRLVLGRPCASDDEAQSLMWPFVAEETRAKLAAVAKPHSWRAFQAEFVRDNLACQARVAIIDLAPDHTGFGNAPTASVPHITFHVDFKGLTPIRLDEFDAEAFMKNIHETHASELLSSLAPHLS